MNKRQYLKKKKVKKIFDHQINLIFLMKHINNGSNYNKNYTVMSYLDNNMQKI